MSYRGTIHRRLDDFHGDAGRAERSCIVAATRTMHSISGYGVPRAESRDK